ncbi:MAG: glycosyltransferase family 4 protein [Bacteroidia bacterium]
MTTRYTICHITSVHHPLDDRIFYKEVLSLNKKYSVCLIAPYSHDFIENYIPIFSVRKFNNRFLRICITPWLLFFKIIKINPKVIHFHDPELIFIGWLLKFLRYKVIYDSHEFYEKQILSKHYLPYWIRKILSFVYNMVYYISLSLFDKIIHVSDYREKELKNKYKNKYSKIAYIKNFPNFDLPSAPPKKNINPSNIKLIYIGGLTAVRGIKEIITAIERIDNVELYLAGSWNPESLYIECQHLKAWSKVKYFGQLPYTQISSLISKCDIGLCLLYPTPNHQFALPVKILEYLSYGLPVIASDFDYWKKTFPKGCLFTNPLNIEEITQSINSLIENPELYDKLSKEGFELVKNHLNWRSEEDKLFQIYNEII